MREILRPAMLKRKNSVTRRQYGAGDTLHYDRRPTNPDARHT
jgi:hypothetical protein